MDLGDLADKAKELAGDLDVDNVKEKLGDVKDAVEGDGSLVDKAKGAFDAIRGGD